MTQTPGLETRKPIQRWDPIWQEKMGQCLGDEKLRYQMVKDHLAIAGIFAFLIGNTSTNKSGAASFPASYVRLPRCTSIWDNPFVIQICPNDSRNRTEVQLNHEAFQQGKQNRVAFQSSKGDSLVNMASVLLPFKIRRQNTSCISFYFLTFHHQQLYWNHLRFDFWETTPH